MTTEALTTKGRATRERIVNAAAELMYGGGVASTSMEDVKAAAGVSSSQLYHYFADRDELVDAVVARQAERVLVTQESELAELSDLASLRAWAAGIVALQESLPRRAGCPIGSLAGELCERDPRYRAALAAAFARWEAAIAAGLARLRDRGAVSSDLDVAAVATGLLAALQGGLLLAQVTDSAAPLAAALTQAIDGVQASAR